MPSRLRATRTACLAAVFACSTLPGAARQPQPPPAGTEAPVASSSTHAAAAPTVGPPPGLPARADRVVSYRIDVRLDATKKQLQGHERLAWRNPSTDAVPELWFHLYLNAFKNTKSTFYKESGGRLRDDDMPEDGWGWIDVGSLKLAGGTDLTKAIRFEAPDDGNADDRTVIRVPLPRPVGPGETVALDLSFTAQLPKVFARTGYKDDYYLVGQWFPKVGVYEPAGTRGRRTGGWNCHQFHANSEFYADYGSFDVTFTVPTSFVVGATGSRVSQVANRDGTTSYRYVQEDVHDFAWTADPHYVERRGTFSATADVSADEYRRAAALVARPEDQVRLSDVEIILLLQPLHRAQAERYLASTKLALKWFGLWYGRYPYRTITVVDPAPGAQGSGGMEYPTFITGGTSFLFNAWPLSGFREAPEGVTVHEVGHQFWYGLVGNNEFEEAWLDEGFNSYSTAKVMDIGYGPKTSVLSILGLHVGTTDVARMQNSPNAKFDVIRQPAWTYQGGGYGFYSYTKPELTLHTLENVLGEQTMARVMRTYHERWRFRHPSSDDFYAVANEVSGRDLTAFFRQAVEGTEVLDYEVASVTSERRDGPAGYFETAKGRALTREADVRKQEAERTDDRRPYETTVMVRRRGEFVMPVDVAFKFEGKAPERVTWDGRDRWKRFTFRRPERLEWVDVDPDRRLLLDQDWLNNARRVTPDARAATAWTARWLFWVQQWLTSIAI